MPLPPPTPERQEHPFLTHDMIREIPQAMEATVSRAAEEAPAMASRAQAKGMVYLTGSGTALFTAMLGAQPLRRVPSPRSLTLPAFELWKYDHPLDGDCLVVGVSHSGVTLPTVQALTRARDAGAHVVGITHFADRPIAAAAHDVLLAGNGPDRSKCHTKCYVAGAVACTQLLREVLSAGGEDLDLLGEGFRELPALAARVLRDVESQCRELAEAHLARTRHCYVGAGPNHPTALEAALKVRETSFLPAAGYEGEEVFHGPWVSLDRDTLLVVLAPEGPGYERAADLVRVGGTVGASTLALVPEGDETVSRHSGHVIELPPVEEALTPFLYILPLYLLAYHTSVLRGVNPDELRYLEPAYWEARQIVFPPGAH